MFLGSGDDFDKRAADYLHFVRSEFYCELSGKWWYFARAPGAESQARATDLHDDQTPACNVLGVLGPAMEWQDVGRLC
jgi:hypothetical protein